MQVRCPGIPRFTLDEGKEELRNDISVLSVSLLSLRGKGCEVRVKEGNRSIFVPVLRFVSEVSTIKENGRCIPQTNSNDSFIRHQS